MSACARAVVHEQWMYLKLQRHTHITLCNQYLYTYGLSARLLALALLYSTVCSSTGHVICPFTL